ncbi:hypothetical protein BGV65_14545 [Burkholderia ubonensis]|nr:hypothetical protein BGV65_14545 [Burkholderia ubonensis]
MTNACKPASFSYTTVVVETTTTRIGVRKLLTADNRRPAVFFRPFTLRACLQWSGLGGGALAHAGSRKRRYANPVMCPATLIGVRIRVPKPAYGGRTMRHIPARPEQTESPLEIICAALRAAALAPSDRDALDVLGAALVCLADLSRAEVASV